jgi:hypothetical protein
MFVFLLLSYDTSLYTVYAVFDGDSEGMEEINLINDHISKEMKLYLNEDGSVYSDKEVIKSFVIPMNDTELLLCSDTTDNSTVVLHAIEDILIEDNIKPLIIEPRNDISTPFYKVALQYNHVVSSVAYEGFGGGFASPAEYEVLKDIVQKETYNTYVLKNCIDDRNLSQFWTPY